MAYTPESAKSPAEEVLVEYGVVSRRSVERRKILQCVGCKIGKALARGDTPEFYVLEVVQCQDLLPGSPYPAVYAMEYGGAIVGRVETLAEMGEMGRRPRVYYHPANNPVGRALMQALEIPEHCPTEERQ